MEEDDAALMHWLRAKKEAKEEEEAFRVLGTVESDDENGTPRMGVPPSSPSERFRQRVGAMKYAPEDLAARIDAAFYGAGTSSGSLAVEDGRNVDEEINRESSVAYLSASNSRRVAFDASSSATPIPEARPLGGHEMTSFERATLESRPTNEEDREGEKWEEESRDLAKAVERAMKRVVSAPLREDVGTSATSRSQNEWRDAPEDYRRNAKRVRLWFRSLGIEVNENAVHFEGDARDATEDADIDRFAFALSKAARDGTLLKEVVEASSKAQIPENALPASSSLVEAMLTFLRIVPGVKPRYLWCQREIERGDLIEATVGVFEDIRTCARWHQ